MKQQGGGGGGLGPNGGSFQNTPVKGSMNMKQQGGMG
eukprot:CAMPEP_0181101766 /NCGR_PEP_ID=MMETSP1071-20121207/13940_1 /TAXON_ID=35127 /ORGANISM="Thalassiosira sp., Strain NH16" /LENGTH=36 /DNA_ID= /DNA_START= /DNA_END= /DNA_ORIENTATION=